MPPMHSNLDASPIEPARAAALHAVDVDARRKGAGTARFGNYWLHSHFQPIYSVPHHRLVGHEALLRACGPDGTPVSPVDVFASCRSESELSDCDRLSRLVHLENYGGQQRQGEWLFLNAHPLAFQRLGQPGAQGDLARLHQVFGMRPGSIVFEVLEAEAADPAQLAESIAIARAAGLLIAIDDFGAGHSNFDRVWRMQPDIVKVDRSLVARAAGDYNARRILAQVVSLLHECGTMVLLEGIETREEALVAIDCDAEMIQGYLLGRPQPGLLAPGDSPAPLRGLREASEQLREQQRASDSERSAPYLAAITELAHLLWQQADASSFAAACRAFLALPLAETCYLLDGQGYQIGDHVWAPACQPDPAQPIQPLREAAGACWGQRPYLRRAIEEPGIAQMTRPYRTLHGQHLCVTVSIAFHFAVDGRWETRVACGDFRWQEAR